jgi:tRNA(fMet)-specific endonuclease VapC
MSFLLDSNIVSAHIRRPSGLSHRFTQHAGRLFVPTPVLAELYAWAYGRPDPTEILTAIDTLLLNEVEVVVYDDQCARWFGWLRSELRRQGVTVPPMDLLIASVALSHDLTLVTNNTADFASIPGLRLEDSLTP